MEALKARRVWTNALQVLMHLKCQSRATLKLLKLKKENIYKIKAQENIYDHQTSLIDNTGRNTSDGNGE